MPKNKRRDINEDEFFGFARSYLSEAFPNPQRIGCPLDAALVRMAERPTEQDAPTNEHLAGCSPCFNRYMEILAELKRKSC
jgi:hypothetical protein